ncbi:MAG: hypothetical protein IJ258_09885 [Methanobrevibacter sp.]|uniref:hypothetical protein n=1 Tax=Methanobrevibacter sp. TaxID=66852 RepID=UPI0025E692C8|nr:hypothetical protein [Methanobrevibacter sp.]MBQ8018395.1 hypothetical protein [Methanobrevibacter sp.]
MSIILILSCLNCVNAQDNDTNIIQDCDDAVLSDSDTGSFTELNDYINSNYGKTIILNKSYEYDSENDHAFSNNGIQIKDKITINGNNHSIDAKGIRIFTITSPDVVLNNITFKNAGKRAMYIDGEATNLVINNSCFTNNSALNCDGGAMYWGGSQGTLQNTIFNENYVLRNNNQIDYVEGGAVYWGGHNGTVKNCIFTNNEARSYVINNGVYEVEHSGNGGALYWYGINGTVTDCVFANNTASRHAGGLYWNKPNGTIKNCNFTNNHAVLQGGAFKNNNLSSTLINCRFIDNYLVGTDSEKGHGGAVYYERGDNIIIDSYFKGNNASYGSAIAVRNLEGVKLSITTTTFEYNQAESSKLPITSSNRNFTATLYGYDNIINNIWNDRKNEIPITIDGVTPVSGVENSDDGSKLYQDTREYNQTIIVSIFDENDNPLYTTTLTTNLYGNVSFITYNGAKIQFKHPNDVIYTEIYSTSDIPPLTLTSQNYVSYANENVPILFNLIDNEENLILDGTITVKVGNETHVMSADKRQVTIKSPDTNGQYPITITYTDPYGINLTKTYTLTVLPRLIEVNITVDDVYYPSYAYAVVSANVSGKYIITVPGTNISKTVDIEQSNKDFNFVLGKINSQNEIYEAQTDLGQILPVGKYNAIITSLVDGYDTATNNDEFNVLPGKIDVHIKADDIIYPDKVRAVVSANVTGKYIISIDGTGITQEITIGEANKDYEIIINHTLPVGKYKITIKSAIDGYENATNSDNFTVKDNQTNKTNTTINNQDDSDSDDSSQNTDNSSLKPTKNTISKTIDNHTTANPILLLLLVLSILGVNINRKN